MSRTSHLPKNVPFKELPFSLNVKGSSTGFAYTGDFVVKVPSVRETGRIGVELARLSDGVPLEALDNSTANLHNAIAFLRVCLVSAPKWFTNTAEDDGEEGMDFGLDTHDFNVPVEIFKKANKLVLEWNKALKGQPKDEEAPRN